MLTKAATLAAVATAVAVTLGAVGWRASYALSGPATVRVTALEVQHKRFLAIKLEDCIGADCAAPVRYPAGQDKTGERELAEPAKDEVNSIAIPRPAEFIEAIND